MPAQDGDGIPGMTAHCAQCKKRIMRRRDRRWGLAPGEAPDYKPFHIHKPPDDNEEGNG